MGCIACPAWLVYATLGVPVRRYRISDSFDGEGSDLWRIGRLVKIRCAWDKYSELGAFLDFYDMDDAHVEKWRRNLKIICLSLKAASHFRNHKKDVVYYALWLGEVCFEALRVTLKGKDHVKTKDRTK